MNVFETKNQNIGLRVYEIHRDLPVRPLTSTRYPTFEPPPSETENRKQPPTQIKKTVAGGFVPHCRYTITIFFSGSPMDYDMFELSPILT